MQIVLCKKKDKDYDQLILKFSNIIKIPRRLINGKESVCFITSPRDPRTVRSGLRPFNPHELGPLIRQRSGNT